MKRLLCISIFGMHMMESRQIKITPVAPQDVARGSYKQIAPDLMMSDTDTFDDVRIALERASIKNIITMRIILGSRKVPDIIRLTNYQDTLASHIPQSGVALVEIIQYKEDSALN